jgi:hypothetical protein
VHWRSIGLVGACVAGGVTLSMMVIGSVPTVGGPVGAVPQALAAEVGVTDQPTTAAVGVTMTTVASEISELPTDAVDDPIPGAEATEGFAVTVADRPPFAATAAQGVAAPTAAPVAPTPVTPTVAAPTPTPTPAPAPNSTAVPTTAPPTTQQPLPPTTVSNLTYPSYTLSGVSDVSLRFDGSSIRVQSLTPQSKWVYEIEKNGPRTVEIKFFNVDTGRDREFHATVEGGRIKVES